MENKNLYTIAEKIYTNEKSKGLTDEEIAQKYYIVYYVTMKTGDSFRGADLSNFSFKQLLALYEIQSVLYKVHRIASTDK